MKVDGSCHCGRIRFEADIDPARIQICHCLDCQRLTGSPFRVSVPAPAAGFRLLSGEPARYLKTADSGSRREHAFCGDCGSPVFRMPTDNDPNYSLRLGSLRQSDQITRPARQVWTKRRLTWVTGLAEIPETHGQPN